METQHSLAQRVAALRQRLELMGPSQPVVPASEAARELHRLQPLADHLQQIRLKGTEAELKLNDLLPPRSGSAPESLPPQLTYRTHRLLLRGRDLLGQLKGMATSLASPGSDRDPVLAYYRETVALAELILRAVQSFPSTVAEQLRLCEGLESGLNEIEARTGTLRTALARRRIDAEQVELLGEALTSVVQGRPPLVKPIQELADALIAEAQAGLPIRWLEVDSERTTRWVASHSLNVAQVMARVAAWDQEWRGNQPMAVLAALIFDSGMAAMPPELLGHAGPLSEEQRRQVEAHVGLSADGVRRLAPAETWLVEVVRSHHERLDGTGYPTGAPGSKIPRLARLLAICDVYAAMRERRAFRPGLAPRTALTETLLEAEKGRLDTELAQLLLELSFYPVGTVVELSDGQIGIVAATNSLRSDAAAAARPIVQVVADPEGKPLPAPVHINLGLGGGRHVIRSLTTDECQKTLGVRTWQLN